MESIKKLINYIESKNEPNFFYVIISFEAQNYLIKCLNSKAVFIATLPDIIWKLNIISNLHPIQACFIGIEYARYLKYNNKKVKPLNLSKNKNHYSYKFHINAILRNQYISYINTQNNVYYVINSVKLALSNKIIKNFSAHDAFYIGLSAGKRLFK